MDVKSRAGAGNTGSSKNKIFGRVINCIAMLTLLFCPPEMPLATGVPILVFACFANPNAVINSDTRPAGLLAPERRATNSMVSWTVKLPVWVSCQSRTAICRGGGTSDTNKCIFLLNIGTNLPQRFRL